MGKWRFSAGLVAATLILPALLPAEAEAVTARQIFETIIPRTEAPNPQKRKRMHPPRPAAPAGAATPSPPLPAPKPGDVATPPPAPIDKPEQPLPPLPPPAPEGADLAPADGKIPTGETILPTPPLGEPAPPAGTVIAPAPPLGAVIAPVQPPQPPAAGPPPEAAAATPPAAPRPPPDPAALAACRAGMESLAIVFKPEPPLVEGDCGAPDPFSVTALAGGAVTLAPAATIDCAVASTLARWLAEDVQPAAKAAFGAEVTKIAVAGSYSCRGRNNIPGAKLSEHAFANAVDIAAFTVGARTIAVGMADGRSLADTGFVATVRQAACTRFTTVLGPGSDAWHEDHLHLDMIRRGRNGDAHFCQ